MKRCVKKKLKGNVRMVSFLWEYWRLFKTIKLEAQMQCITQVRKDTNKYKKGPAW